MSSMHTPPTTVEPFAVVRKGFDREQVTAALSRLEAEAELLRACLLYTSPSPRDS